LKRTFLLNSPQVNSLSCSEKKKTKLELNSIFDYEFQGHGKKKEKNLTPLASLEYGKNKAIEIYDQCV